MAAAVALGSRSRFRLLAMNIFASNTKTSGGDGCGSSIA